MKKITKYHKKMKFVYVMSAAVVCFIIMLAFPWVGSVLGHDSGYYVLVIDGEEVAAATSKEVIEEAILNARLQLNEEADSIVYIEPAVEIYQEDKLFGSMETEKNLEDIVYTTLKESTGLTKQLAYVVSIDGFTVTLENKEDVVALLEAAKSSYDPEEDFDVDLTETTEGVFSTVTYSISKVDIEANSAGTVLASESGAIVDEDDPTSGAHDGIIGLSFDEDIEILETCADAGDIVSLGEAVNLVTKETESNKIYEVQSGDTLSGIASSYGLSLSKLLSMNSGLSETSTIGIGDQIVVTVPEPELSVVVNQETTYEEAYNAEVQYIDDDSMYKGQSVVVDPGTDGYRKVTAVVTYRNGEEIGREIVAQTLMSESTPKIIRRGTQIPPTYVKPISGGSISSYFGYRWGRLHSGVDWYCGIGTAVNASCGGTVVSAGWSSGYGYCIVIQHPDGKQTRYAHLSKIYVSSGQSVSQYERIGLSGNTGRSTGPHLHFEIIVNGAAVNPLRYLS